MKTYTRRVLPFLAPLLLAFVPAADELRYDPKPGTETTKKLEISLELSLDDVTFEVNDQPMPEALGQLKDMALSLELVAGVTEKVAVAKDGRATDFLRTFDSIHGKAEAGENSSEDSFSELEGKTVHFLWDATKSEYAKSWHECTGKDEILNTLSPDMDVSTLLPPKKVSKGDKWEVGGEKVLPLLIPGLQPGTVDLDKAGLGANESKAMQIMIDELGPQLEEGLKHLRVGCEYAGSHDADGVSVGDVKLHLEGEMKLDLGPVFERIAAEQSSGGPEPTVDASVTLSLKGDGALLWNAETHVLQSCTLDADLQLHLKANASADEGGQSMKFKAALGIGGKGSWKLGADKPGKPAETPAPEKKAPEKKAPEKKAPEKK
jgi:hypothetical protein